MGRIYPSTAAATARRGLTGAMSSSHSHQTATDSPCLLPLPAGPSRFRPRQWDGVAPIPRASQGRALGAHRQRAWTAADDAGLHAPAAAALMPRLGPPVRTAADDVGLHAPAAASGGVIPAATTAMHEARRTAFGGDETSCIRCCTYFGPKLARPPPPCLQPISTGTSWV